MTVLLVDDNPISSTVLQCILDKYGYVTHSAKDGEQALRNLDAHPEIQLVITDIVMPKTDGFELVRRIKERPELEDLPILVCTSQSPASVQSRLPMDGWKYLFKPIRADSLIQKVSEAFAQKRKFLQDPELTREQIGIDYEGFVEVVDKFSETVDEAITRLEQQGEDAPQEPVDLKDLLEGAKLIRAERLIDILTSLENSPYGRKREMIRTLYPVLLRESKAMRHHLICYCTRNGARSPDLENENRFNR